MIRFEFRLRPLRDLTAWYSGDGSNPHMSWYGLTDGWYWIRVGEVELFRYTQAALDMWAKRAQELGSVRAAPSPPYDDYPVAHLWSEVLDMLPDVMAPIPPALAQALMTGAWTEWEQQAEAEVAQTYGKGEAWWFSPLLYDAMRWLGKRKLDSAYLVAGPNIHFWSVGGKVHVQWDNRDRVLDGVAVWEATIGHKTMQPAAFLDAVRDFDARFMRRMADRVAIAQAEWQRPDVKLDPRIAEAQVANARESQRLLTATKQREPDDWAATFDAIRQIESLPSFTSSQAPRLALE